MRRQREHRGACTYDDQRLEYAPNVELDGRSQLHAHMNVPMPVVLITQGRAISATRGGRLVLVSEVVLGSMRRVVSVYRRMRRRSTMTVPTDPLGAVRMRDAVRKRERRRREAGNQRQEENGPAGPDGSSHDKKCILPRPNCAMHLHGASAAR